MSSTNAPAGPFLRPNASQLDSQPRRQVGRSFWLQWVLANAFGWAMGIILYSIFQFAIATIFASIFVGLLLASLGTIAGGAFGGIVAASFGFTQGSILKQYRYSIRQYTKASFIGGIIGGALSAVLIFILLFVFASSQAGQLITIMLVGIAGAATGTVVGYKQKSLLQRQGLEINHCVLANAVGWTVGCTVSAVVGQVLHESVIWPLGESLYRLSPAIVLAVICGLIGGAITGYPLMRALQQPSLQNPKSEIQNESSSSYVG